MAAPRMSCTCSTQLHPSILLQYRLLGLDAILLITGWDGCYNLGSKSLVEWLCESSGTQPADMEDALEEGLFVITPDDVDWFIAHEADVPVQVSIA